MAGIYIHIPFCKSRCKYCDFYSTLHHELKENYTQTLCKEIERRKVFLEEEPIKTIYFGGGTPSQLTIQQLHTITEQLQHCFDLRHVEEQTIELNPSDITTELLSELRVCDFNRISIGIQTFDNECLRLIGRRHDRETAIKAVKAAQDAGFKNISIDIMYGMPIGEQQSIEILKSDLQQALELNIQHISTYCLTYEQGTALTKARDKDEIKSVTEDTENLMFDFTHNILTQNDFEHYEVSNYALKGFRSQHNSNYWNHTPYLGIGAAAHSYNNRTRQSNPADIRAYIEAYQDNRDTTIETEQLTDTDFYNEQIMLQLRRQEGIDLQLLTKQQRDYCLLSANKFIKQENLVYANNRLYTTLRGMHILNYITEELMM